MNRDDIRERILLGLRRAGLAADDIRVQPDPYSGWRIAIVSAGFAGMSPEARRRAALAELPHLRIQWLDVLTPDERTWAGALPEDIEPDQLPLWPESLARGRVGAGQPVFPSDLDEDLEPPIVATFYSLRGGVGRSTALAYTAHLLADRGKKIICVDLDLEAPGLAALFGKEDVVEEDQGVVRLLLDLEQRARPDMSKHLIRISEARDLYCLPAGRPDADYARKLSLLDPEAWYREDRNPLRELIDGLAKGLPFRPDVLLLDARTGITRLSGPLLFDLADLAFVLFFPHPQARTGTGGLVRALLASRTRRSTAARPLTPEPRFVVSPIPASKVPVVVQRYRHRAAEWIHEWLERPDAPRSNRWVESEITHFIPYQEVLATSDQIFVDPEIWKTYEPLSDWIQRFLPTAQENGAKGGVARDKLAGLQELRFPTGTAEEQDDLLQTFIKTDAVRRVLEPNVPLVIGRKGTGKTAVFRWLLEEHKDWSIPVLAPAKLRKAWQLSADGFKAAEEMLRRQNKEWRELWAAYVCFACHLEWRSPTSRDELVPSELRDAVLGLPIHTEREFLNNMERVLLRENGPLLVREWLARLDRAAASTYFLLFDGLDTGFGSAPADRERRTRSVEGLFTLLTDQGDRLKQLAFKILLREDIWKSLRFDNKSHLYGRSVRLAWDNKADYLAIVLKHALRSAAFQRLAKRGDESPLALWDHEAVYQVWNVLVGERMKGGKTTYTSNWVWYRLADANNDHAPRALLQLFRHATEWERNAQATNPYDRSLLRPRALIESLDAVSQEALGALLEEFSELEPLRQRLEELRRTPVLARDLDDLNREVALAKEVGLLSVYEGTDSDPIRYRVPDIYRIALQMTRMGQL